MACNVRGAAAIVRFDDEKRIRQDGTVRWRLMEPAYDQDLGRHAQSVTYVEDLCCAGILEEGEKWLERHGSQKNLSGWAEFDVGDATGLDLQVYRDNSPPRHGNITGWATKKENRNREAKELANLVNGMRVDQISC